ncbi:hypothetical protein VIGAN_01159100 [Vigna angularis var. angularis]|uniref:Uncharacterized protein n=1 Tax=Vigna angularis var. angularis TaxID=157739 RepID=A0A0S3R067_PHAAN|nr:hypothetical protein VIGAN_01159100 [Vigna angularis var. angularis]
MDLQIFFKIFEYQINAMCCTWSPIQFFPLLHQQLSGCLEICSIISDNLNNIFFSNKLDNIIQHFENFISCF